MISMQIWFIGRTLASQAGKAGSTPVIRSIRNPWNRWNFKGFSIVVKDP